MTYSTPFVFEPFGIIVDYLPFLVKLSIIGIYQSTQNFTENLNIIVDYLLSVPVHSNRQLFLVILVECWLFHRAAVEY